jgi:hypothetical protein
MIRVALSAAALAVGLSGCATPARYVERQPGAGVIAIPANTDTWPTYNRRAALALIEQHLGSGYEIVEEREVATGKTTSNNQQVRNEETINTAVPFLPANRQTVTNTTTTRDVTEWRISYRKRAEPAADPPGDPPGGGVRRTEYRSGSGPDGVKPAGGADCKQ